jgi:hypothetical protein
MPGDSLRSTPVTNAAYLTLNGAYGKNNNDAHLTFKPLNSNLAPVAGNYYSLSTNQTSDPTIRINQWSSDGTLINYGYLYDSRFNQPPSSGSSSGSGYKLVAGGNGPDVLLYSTGSNPTTFASSLNGSEDLSQCLALASNGTIWVAGGQSDLLYSSTGDTWFQSTNGAALLDGSSCVAVATNGSFWVAGTQKTSNTVLYSYDGKTWYTSATGSMLLTSVCNTVVWNGSMWVAGGAGSVTTLIYSNDGITWSISENGTLLSAQCIGLVWNGTFWLAGGEGTTQQLVSSYDGIHWTGAGNLFSAACFALAYNGSLFVAGGRDPTSPLRYSYNGLTWTPATASSSLFTTCYTVIWTGSNWVAGGAGPNVFLESDDGITWTAIQTSSVTEGRSLATNRIMPLPKITSPVMLMGGNGYSPIATSTDGITWAPINPLTNPDLSGQRCAALAWNGSIWVGGFLYGDNTVCYSYDGLTWTKSSSGSTYLNNQCLAFAFSKTKWLAGGKGTNNYMISSTNEGQTWATVSSADNLITSPGYIKTIGYNGSVWIAGAGETTNKLLYSSDGSNGIIWAASASGNSIFGGTYCNSVAWNGQIWIAVGGNIIAYSSDGSGWLQASATTVTGSWNTVANNGSLWVVGGAGGGGNTTIAYSYDGLKWFPSSSAATIFTVSCKSVAWTGSLWIAGGEGTQTSAYSYNGITWFPSPTGIGLLSPVESVASTRINLLDASAIPPPVLYPSSSTIPGNVVYSTGLNSMYTSSIMSIDNFNAVVSIQGDLSANTFRVGSFNPARITTTDISATNISASSTVYTSNIVGTGIGTLTLGSSSINPSAIIISDSDTQIANLSIPTTIRVNNINSADENQLAIVLSANTNTIYNASIQPYTVAITPPPDDIYDLSDAGIYTIEATSLGLYTLIIRKPGRYIICNQGWDYIGSPYTSINIKIMTFYNTVSVIIVNDQLVNTQQSLTFDIYLGTVYKPGAPIPIVPGLVGTNVVVTDIEAIS